MAIKHTTRYEMLPGVLSTQIARTNQIEFSHYLVLTNAKANSVHPVPSSNVLLESFKVPAGGVGSRPLVTRFEVSPSLFMPAESTSLPATRPASCDRSLQTLTTAASDSRSVPPAKHATVGVQASGSSCPQQHQVTTSLVQTTPPPPVLMDVHLVVQLADQATRPLLDTQAAPGHGLSVSTSVTPGDQDPEDFCSKRRQRRPYSPHVTMVDCVIAVETSDRAERREEQSKTAFVLERWECGTQTDSMELAHTLLTHTMQVSVPYGHLVTRSVTTLASRSEVTRLGRVM
ncbi:unnamed protein product [Protopolystoma xenopodis]|uniref:Uncharacterized protein n=1 Tax=Protopolystoma xenopodis TaxID=117903 RepID=A0A448WSM0_9PLAT|nr:unnamed protein product [Protopolystoma xenopodis]